jgi:hypothetical protein
MHINTFYQIWLASWVKEELTNPGESIYVILCLSVLSLTPKRLYKGGIMSVDSQSSAAALMCLPSDVYFA